MSRFRHMLADATVLELHELECEIEEEFIRRKRAVRFGAGHLVDPASYGCCGRMPCERTACPVTLNATSTNAAPHLPPSAGNHSGEDSASAVAAPSHVAQPTAGAYRWIAQASALLKLWLQCSPTEAEGSMLELQQATDGLLSGVPCPQEDLGFDSPADRAARSSIEAIPEGCTPADAMVLRDANFKLVSLINEIVPVLEMWDEGLDEMDGADYERGIKAWDEMMKKLEPYRAVGDKHSARGANSR